MVGAQSVSQAVDSRLSVRAYLDMPVDPGLVRDILRKAGRAPSGGNLQPWHIYVLGGSALADFRVQISEKLKAFPKGEGQTEYAVYPEGLVSPYEDRRFAIGEDMYATMGIAREDKRGRVAWFMRNFQFFGAPLGLFCFVHRQMGSPQWADLGMYLQTVMLLLREAGLDSCAQECWYLHHKTVSGFVQAPPELMLFCGMAIGYRDESHPVNGLRSRRAALDDYATFMGI